MKYTTVKLVRDFYAPVSMDEMKALTSLDRQQLASGIARFQGLTQADCEFDLIPY